MIEYYIIQKKFLLKNPFFMFLANFIFVVSQLKIHPAVHLDTLLWRHSSQKEKFIKSLQAFVILMF